MTPALEVTGLDVVYGGSIAALHGLTLTVPDDDYLTELNEAYNHFFFHYTATPLLVVETSQVDVSWGDDAVDELLKQIKSMGRGTQYYVPRTG